MFPKIYFITGTDTHVGKTWVTVGLLMRLQRQKFSPMAIKPLASGCAITPWGLHNADALLLQQYNTRKLDYNVINPVCCGPSVAPHLVMRDLNCQKIVDAINSGATWATDYLLVEGVGGWRVPLNTHETMADVVKALKIPVIMVVGIRLGCLNHALLTYEAICQDGLSLRGWIANCIDPAMEKIAENIDTLQRRIAPPLLGIVPYQSEPNASRIADALDTVVL